jgi:hypothetical protein
MNMLATSQYQPGYDVAPGESANHITVLNLYIYWLDYEYPGRDKYYFFAKIGMKSNTNMYLEKILKLNNIAKLS